MIENNCVKQLRRKGANSSQKKNDNFSLDHWVGQGIWSWQIQHIWWPLHHESVWGE
jgi:hypothetical protein